MSVLIKNCLVLPMDRKSDSKLYFRGSIGVVDQKIVFVCAQADADYNGIIDAFVERYKGDNDFTLIDGTHFLAMPGLINIHNHASMTLMRSYADDMKLMPWLNEKIWPFEAQMTREDIYMGAKLGIIEMLLGGTTTFVDMYWQQEVVALAVEESGIRAVLSPTLVSNKIKDFDTDTNMLLERYAEGKHSRIDLIIAPHAVYSCSTEDLIHAREVSEKYGVGINIHVAETLQEMEIVEKSHGKSPIEYVNDLGLLTPKTIAAHCVHLSDRDICILRDSGASVAYNPQSNMKLGSGISPVAKMIKVGINVGIGTDGPSSNNDLDMWDEMRSASFLQKVATGDPCVLPAYDVLKMATVNGAHAIGRSADLGVLASGMLADIILVDIEKPHYYPRHDMVANLVYCGKSTDVDTVLVGGKFVVRGGKVLNLDVKMVCAEVERRSVKIQ